MVPMSVVALLDALDARVRGGARPKLNLRPPAPDKLAALKAEIGDLATAGWGAHDGQDRPVKKRPTIQGEPAKPAMHWLPGDFRWLSIDEALDFATSRFQQFADSKGTLGRDARGRLVRVPWASTNSFGAGLWIELADGRLVFRDREDYGPGRTVARSLEHFFEQYLRSLEKDRLRWDAKSKRVTFGRKALVYAFSAD
jgi:hypothetical protein